MKILVSACLLGENCRYKGDNCKNEKVLALKGENELIAVCPEVLGGLPTPRAPAEIVGDKVIANTGKDVTENYKAGAEAALCIARETKADYCIFKSKSPSCGCGEIYDGTFSGKLTAGNGITAELFLKNGYAVKNENSLYFLVKIVDIRSAT